MTEFRGCWDVSKNRRTHYIRSIDRLGRATVPECGVGAVSELCGIVDWLRVELYSGETRPSVGERVSDRSRSEDGIDPVDGNGCRQGPDDMLHPRKEIFRGELIEG